MADRDEPLVVGANYQRDEEPNQDAESEAIRRHYGARIELVSRNLSREEREAIIRALREEMAAALRAIAERRRQNRIRLPSPCRAVS